MQILFRLLSIVVKWCRVATHIKEIKHSMLGVTGVYLIIMTDMSFVILHLNVIHLSVCSSCFVVLFVLFLFNFLIFVLSVGMITLVHVIVKAVFFVFVHPLDEDPSSPDECCNVALYVYRKLHCMS